MEEENASKLQTVVEYTTTLKVIAAKLASKLIDDSNVTISTEDRPSFENLEAGRLSMLREIKDFTEFFEGELQQVQTKIRKNDVASEPITFKDLTYGTEKKHVGVVLSDFAERASDLATKYGDLAEALEKSQSWWSFTKIFNVGVLVASIFSLPIALSGLLYGNLTILALKATGVIKVDDAEVEIATNYLKKSGEQLENVQIKLGRVAAASYAASSFAEILNGQFDKVFNNLSTIREGIAETLKQAKST